MDKILKQRSLAIQSATLVILTTVAGCSGNSDNNGTSLQVPTPGTTSTPISTPQPSPTSTPGTTSTPGSTPAPNPTPTTATDPAPANIPAAMQMTLTLEPNFTGVIGRNRQVITPVNALPVGYGSINGRYSDYRGFLSFGIPDSVPSNAIVTAAQLTMSQLPSGRPDQIGFAFDDPTPNNVSNNSITFDEVTFNREQFRADNFDTIGTPTLTLFSIRGNVLGGDTFAGPRKANVKQGVQQAVNATNGSGTSRQYQIRMQCLREVWNNGATPQLTSNGEISQGPTGVCRAEYEINTLETAPAPVLEITVTLAR